MSRSATKASWDGWRKIRKGYRPHMGSLIPIKHLSFKNSSRRTEENMGYRNWMNARK